MRLARKIIPRLSREIVADLESQAQAVVYGPLEEAQLDVGAVLVDYCNTMDLIEQGRESVQAPSLIELATSVLSAVRDSEYLDLPSSSEPRAHELILARLAAYLPDPDPQKPDPDSDPDLPPAAQGRLVG